MENNIYKKIYDLLASGQKIVLAKTIRRSGSTPRDVGAMCIITQQQKLIGTVGGGILEYRVQKKAAKLLEQGRSFIYRFRLTSKDLAGAGMICGGNVDLYLEPLFPENNDTLSFFKTLQRHMADNSPGMLVTRIKDGISAMAAGTRMFIPVNGKTIGTIPGIDPEKIIHYTDTFYHMIDPDDQKDQLFIEKIALDPRIFLFGGGHVSMFVAKLAKMVGFAITLIDDRPEFANAERFPGADEIFITDFHRAFEQLKIFSNAYILIITRGHLHDKIVLQHALSTDAAYIGMIGSTQKRDTIYRALMDEGFKKEDLEQINSPIGLDIHAETPEEIAVSIVGELIKKRAPAKKKKNLIS